MRTFSSHRSVRFPLTSLDVLRLFFFYSDFLLGYAWRSFIFTLLSGKA